MGFPARVRFVLCLLLAVTTATGGAVSLRACACPSAARPGSAPPAAHKPVHNCCKSAAKPGACCANKAAEKAACCAAHPPAERPAFACTCERPAAPDAPAPVAPAAPDAEAWATPSPVPPLPLALPADRANRLAPAAGPLPPTDLVISLSRFTC